MTIARLSFSFPGEMKDELLILAKKDSRKLSSYIQKILQNHIINNTDSIVENENARASVGEQNYEDNPDRLNLECPGCGAFVPINTYHGPCEDIDFSVDEAPLLVIAEVNEESRQDRVVCPSCGIKIALEVKFLAIEKQLSDVRKFNKKWRID